MKEEYIKRRITLDDAERLIQKYAPETLQPQSTS